MIDLRGKPIAITGASSGIGRAAAIACAKAGMPVVAGARREDRLRELVLEIERGGGRAISVACDVVNPADCERLIAEGEKAFGPLYSVFANAGYGLEREAAELSDAEFREIFETNFWGTVNTVKPAVLRMLARTPDATASRGHVLICTSAMSKIALPCFAAYSTTKAAQDHYGRALRLELARQLLQLFPRLLNCGRHFDDLVRVPLKLNLLGHRDQLLLLGDQVFKFDLRHGFLG